MPVGTASLTGRIVADGKPVTSYAIALGSSERLGVMDDTLLVTDIDGRFAIPDVAAGSYHLFVGAHGFLRTTTDVHLTDGRITDLGDIPLVRGVRITGHVVDDDGKPVAAATVRVEGGSMTGSVLSGRRFDELRSATVESEALHGRQRVTTDATGAYELVSAVPKLDGDAAWITVESDPAKTAVPSHDATVDLAVLAFGDLQVRVPDRGSHWVRYHRVDGDSPGETLARTPTVMLDHLHAGTYDVWLYDLGGSPTQPRRVTVGSRQKTTVDFSAPLPATVEVSIRCDHFVRVIPAGLSDPDEMLYGIAQGLCSGGELTFTDVEPGTYSVCGKRCIPMTVAPAPVRQTFDATGALTAM